MNTFRDSSISITNRTRWMLTRIVRAAEKGNTLDVPLTTDGLAEKIIAGWLEQNHPSLIEAWKKRESIEREAEQTVRDSQKVEF